MCRAQWCWQITKKGKFTIYSAPEELCWSPNQINFSPKSNKNHHNQQQYPSVNSRHVWSALVIFQKYMHWLWSLQKINKGLNSSLHCKLGKIISPGNSSAPRLLVVCKGNFSMWSFLFIGIFFRSQNETHFLTSHFLESSLKDINCGQCNWSIQSAPGQFGRQALDRLWWVCWTGRAATETPLDPPCPITFVIITFFLQYQCTLYHFTE